MAGKDNQKVIITLSQKGLCVSMLLFFIFLSCQSAPEVPYTALAETGGILLESGASVYILADVKEARPIIDILPIQELKNRQTRQMLDRTNFCAAALFPQESNRRFQLVAWGDYQNSGAAMAFGMNRNWKKQRSAAGYPWWYSRTDGLSIALNPRQAFVSALSDNAPGDPVTAAPGVEIPEGFGEFRRGAPFSCWLDDPGLIINRMLNNGGLPVNFPAEKLFIVLFPAEEGQYEAVVRLQFESASLARGMAAIFTLAGSFVSLESGQNPLIFMLLFANPPVQSGRNLDIKTAVLSEDEIVQLLRSFPVF
jgi:hypothetical protein